MKRCMYCGQENEDSAATCVKCGNRLLTIPADEAEQAAERMAEDPALSQVPDFPEAEEAPWQEVPGGVPDLAPEAANAAPEAETLPGVEEADGASDVQRGQTYAAQQQYNGVPESIAYGGQDYSYSAAAGEQQQYEGAAYGYAQQPQMTQEPYPVREHAAGRNALREETIRIKSRKRVKSFLWFLLSVTFTLATVASIINGITGNALTNIVTSSNFITRQLGAGMVKSSVDMGIGVLTGLKPLYVRLGLLVSSIPAVFVMIGLWMAFFGTTRRDEETSTSGLTMIRVIEIIKFVFACLVLLAGIVFSVSYLVIAINPDSKASSDNSMMTLLFGIILLLVVVIIAVLTIMYFVQLIFSLKLIRTNVQSGIEIGRIPGFLIFIGFIRCLICVASLIPMDPKAYNNLGLFGYDIGFLAQGLTALWLLIAVVWGIIYKATVKTD